MLRVCVFKSASYREKGCPLLIRIKEVGANRGGVLAETSPCICKTSSDSDQCVYLEECTKLSLTDASLLNIEARTI